MEDATLNLLERISSCTNVPICLKNDLSQHPCLEIVRSQGCNEILQFQVPEPWNGHIETAPLLYLSSNPSVSEIEEYPRWDWDTELILDFFTNRFGDGIQDWVRNGNRGLARDGSYLEPTPYWSEIKNRSTELFGRTAIPGVDYVLTEIVHCKSRNMIGVDEAIDECGSRYLQRILSVAEANVLVTVGVKVGRLLKLALNLDSDLNIAGPILIGGKKRIVLFFPAPGSSKPRKIEKLYTTEEIHFIRSHLTAPPL